MSPFRYFRFHVFRLILMLVDSPKKRDKKNIATRNDMKMKTKAKSCLIFFVAVI